MTDTTAAPAPPPPTPAPPADEVRAWMRSQNIKGAIGLVLVMALVAFTAYLASGGRAASRDNLNNTRLSLANNARNDCIQKRRNDQAEAIGRETLAAHRAQRAGLLQHDEAEAARQAAIVELNAEAWEVATKSLSREVLNQPPPLGCGPPITTLADVPSAH